jgi:hypothetical protein
MGIAGMAMVAASSGAQDVMEKGRRDNLMAGRDAWYAAFARGDIEAMDKVEAKEFVVISDRSVATKEEQLRGIRQAVEGKKWLPEGTTTGTDDLKIRFEGPIAVVTGRGWVKGPGQADPPKARDALTEVWAERGGRWTVLHLHYHRVPDTTDQPK